MKARDIIAGWPRPRSTVAPRPRLGFFGPTTEELETLHYHERQQAMVTALFENWRLGRVVRRDEIAELILGMLPPPLIPFEAKEWARLLPYVEKLTGA